MTHATKLTAMKSTTQLVTAPALLAALLIAPLLGACTKESTAANPPAGPGASDTAPDLGELDLPTQDQADQKAAEEITSENAAAELEKLKEELQGDD